MWSYIYLWWMDSLFFLRNCHRTTGLLPRLPEATNTDWWAGGGRHSYGKIYVWILCEYFSEASHQLEEVRSELKHPGIWKISLYHCRQPLREGSVLQKRVLGFKCHWSAQRKGPGVKAPTHSVSSSACSVTEPTWLCDHGLWLDLFVPSHLWNGDAVLHDGWYNWGRQVTSFPWRSHNHDTVIYGVGRKVC